MSANNYLYLTKTKTGYRLREMNADITGTKVDRDGFWYEDFKDLGEAMKRAGDMMEVEDIEYGLRLGKLN
jgi:hypothetical protein